MIVVAIIGILAAVAVPKFADLVTKSKEAAVKGALGSVRSALSIYYGDTEGVYPNNLHAALTTNNKYMPAVAGLGSLGRFEIPVNSQGNPGHNTGTFKNASVGSAVFESGSAPILPSEGAAALAYGHTSTTLGEVYMNCQHKDSKSQQWTAY